MNESAKDRPADHPLLFEIGAPGLNAVWLPDSDVPAQNPAQWIPPELLAVDGPPWPEVGELDVVRHYKRLAHRCFSIDGNFYPLGSCTMKYNPRVNERVAALPGFLHLHPHQPVGQVQGALQLMSELEGFLAEISGMDAVTLQPSAGAQGELTGILLIKA